MSFPLVEMQVQKFHTSSLEQRTEGRWVTKHCLVTSEHWTRKMADAAFDWASSRGLVRVNSMHGEQEARLVLGQSFSMKDEQGTTTTERDKLSKSSSNQAKEPSPENAAKLASENIKGAKTSGGGFYEDDDADLADELLTGFEQGAESAARIVRLATVANNRLKKHGTLEAEDLQEDQYKDQVEVLQWSCAAVNRFWRCAYGNGLWLSRRDAENIVLDGWAFTDGYATLASLCSRQGWRGFNLRPKLHMFCHLVLDVQHMLESNRDCQFIENPAVHATWTDEDFIGRVSRISRRTSVLTAPLNTILRSLGLYRREWASEFHASYLHPPP
ncbi:Uncharacterized protein SCF082_LOCUS1499 [Durusdinium trenchii]|uniref:Uncharacterized protein n=1 Tax=Durusdinium trenchii TaxID=1381693 RepID=A0ABP0HEP8_9DINO